MKRLIVGVIFGLAVLAGAGPAAAQPGDGPPDVWTGSLRGAVPGLCVQIYAPVHDVHGVSYLNAACAASFGVRVTWPGEL